MFANQVAAAPTKEEKIEILRRAARDKNFMVIFDLAFSPIHKFSRLPQGVPANLKPQMTGENEGYLKHFLLGRKYRYFLDGQNDTIREAKLSLMYLNLLENCHPDDRNLMIAVVGKRFPFEGIDYGLFREAFLADFTGFWPAEPGGGETETASQPEITAEMQTEEEKPKPVVKEKTKPSSTKKGTGKKKR